MCSCAFRFRCSGNYGVHRIQTDCWRAITGNLPQAEQVLAARLGADAELRDAVARYDHKARHEPHGIAHFGIRYPSFESLEIVIDRIAGRRVCPNGHVYHWPNMPPKVLWVCDKCGEEVVQRPDDTEEAVN